MRSFIKRAVIGAYCRGWISWRTVEKLFYYFDLYRH
jgi:hypothetical protein